MWNHYGSCIIMPADSAVIGVYSLNEKAAYYVYIVACSDGTLYTGTARDLAARIEKHNQGLGAKYTRGRLPVALVYSEKTADKSVALKRELAIKGMGREAKLALIEESPSQS